MATTEQDLRLQLLNTLLTTPHRQLHEIWPVHKEMVASDPRFYARLAAWYNRHGDVRDHKEMFVVTLVQSDFAGHRDAGLALLRQMPPYELVRVVDFIHGRKTTRKVRAPRPGSRGRKAEKAPEAPEPPDEKIELVTESFGLFKNPPRSLKTEVARYLREREADAEWFDSTVLSARKAVKRLYALFHLAPGPRAQQILFDDEPPAGSRLLALRQLAKATTPADQARAILENRIPYRVASTVVKQMTPTVLLALVSSMSGQELINNIASLKKRGALDNPDLKALIEEKLEAAKSGPRISALKTGKAIAAADAGADITAKLEQIADTQVKAKGRISRPTALLIDKSGSMTPAIELGKRIAAMISAVWEKELYVLAFDTMPYPIECSGSNLASWERAMAGITAGGGTSCGVALEYLRLKGRTVEQIILVTDEGENNEPRFVPTLQKYRQTLKADPAVCIVRTPGGINHLETQCNRAQIPVDVFQFSGDYYSLPNLVPLLSKPSRLELLMEIMEYPLPKRRPA